MSMLFSVRRCFLIAIISLLSTAMLTAQVKIKEKVEIAPKVMKVNKTNSSSSDVPCLVDRGISPQSTTQIIGVGRAGYMLKSKMTRQKMENGAP